MTKLADNLKVLRLQNKLTHQFVADQLKITKAAYSKLEVGTTEPSLKLMIRTADLFNVSLDELVGRQFTPNGKVIDQLRMKKEMTKEINSLVKQIGNEFIQSKEADIVKRLKQKFNLV